jgi:hypothetical protein
MSPINRRGRTTLWALGLTVATAATVPGVSHATTNIDVPATATATPPPHTSSLRMAAGAGGDLTLTWAEVPGADSYTLLDDRTGDIRFVGTATRTAVSALPGSSLDLALFADTESGVLHIADLLTTVPSAGAISGITAVTTAEGTTLSWLPVSGVEEYVVSQDEHVLLRTSATSTTLSARLGDSVRYSVLGELPESPDDVVLAVDLSPSRTAADGSLDNGDGDVIAANTKTIGTSLSRYETFIPYEFVDSYQVRNYGDYFEPVSYACEGPFDAEDYWFGGDNRDQSPGTATWNSGKFRTQGNGYTYWSSKSNKATKSVQATKRYVKSGSTYSFKDSRTADGTGFSVRALSNDGRTSRWVLDHEVANPYCDKPTGGITYTSQQDLYSNGGHYIYGAHDKAPNHSVHRADYYTDGTSSVQLVFVHQVEAFKCLSWTAGCGARNYQYVR